MEVASSLHPHASTLSGFALGGVFFCLPAVLLPMPTAAPRPCSHPGCGVLVRDGSGRCAKHPKQSWAKKPTAAKRITGRKLQQLRKDLFEREPLCRPCYRKGVVTLATMRDHVVSVEEGGSDTDDNVQPICKPCHDVKSEAERARGVRRAWSGHPKG